MSNYKDNVELLKSGNFNIHKTANDDRVGFYKEMKPYIDSGEIIRDIQPAPRCARYKIHYYYKPGVNLHDTIGIGEYSTTFNAIKKIMNLYDLPIDFDFKNSKFGDFEVIYKNNQWSIKYKGNVDRLHFTGSDWNGVLATEKYPNSDFLSKPRNEPKIMYEFRNVIYQIANYIERFNIKYENPKT